MRNDSGWLQARVGCVKYLNSRPLIAHWPGTARFDHPAQLAMDLAGGKLDAALVPVFALFENPEFLVVDGIGIVSHGPVHSVYLAHKSPVESATVLLADTASRTSLHLAQILLRECHQAHPAIEPRTITSPSELTHGEAALLIGNQAIGFRREHAADVKFWDLGEVWKMWCGLPFVYAVWLVRPDFAGADGLAQSLREAAGVGVNALEKLLAEIPAGIDREFARNYLTQNIQFSIGPAEKRGLDHFRALCIKHRFVKNAGTFTWL